MLAPAVAASSHSSVPFPSSFYQKLETKDRKNVEGKNFSSSFAKILIDPISQSVSQSVSSYMVMFAQVAIALAGVPKGSRMICA